MSRSNYDDDIDRWQLIMWRGAVASAIRGARGQALLREMRDALEAMPVKVLIANELDGDGGYCALGVVGTKRGIDMTEFDPEDTKSVAKALNIADALAREVVYINDEAGWGTRGTDADRWDHVHSWVCEKIRPDENKGESA